MKILVGIPTLDYMSSDTAMCLARMFGTPQHHRKLGEKRPIHLGICHVANSNYTDARNTICQALLDAPGFDRVLMLDSDMVFPPDTVSRLANHNALIVGATYTTRDKDGTNRVLGTRLDGAPFDIRDAGPLSTVLDLPMGCMMIDRRVLERLPKPWFRFPMTDTHTRSEDVYFCHTANNAGIPVMCDTVLSRELGHVGTHTYRI